MNTNRRDFLRNLGSKAAGAAATVVTPVMAYDFSHELKRLSGQFNQKLDKVSDLIGAKTEQLSNRIDSVALTQTYQQTMIHLIFLLLIISYVIDGGMTTWLFIQ